MANKPVDFNITERYSEGDYAIALHFHSTNNICELGRFTYDDLQKLRKQLNIMFEDDEE